MLNLCSVWCRPVFFFFDNNADLCLSLSKIRVLQEKGSKHHCLAPGLLARQPRTGTAALDARESGVGGSPISTVPLCTFCIWLAGPPSIPACSPAPAPVSLGSWHQIQDLLAVAGPTSQHCSEPGGPSCSRPWHDVMQLASQVATASTVPAGLYFHLCPF
jgi:hypothetical protein